MSDYEKARKWDYLVEHGITSEELQQELTTIEHIREYLSVMKDEPDEYILLSKVYHNLRRILGDE